MNFLRQAIQLLALDIDKSKLRTLWYENEDGDKYVPDFDKIDGPDDVPDGYKYQISQFPTYLRTTYLKMTPDGSEEVMSGESGWPEDLVLAMAESGDFTLSEAILVAAQACERCMNSCAYEYGLDWGYPEGSEEWQKANTMCEFCTTEEEWQDYMDEIKEESAEDAAVFETEAALPANKLSDEEILACVKSYGLNLEDSFRVWVEEMGYPPGQKPRMSMKVFKTLFDSIEPNPRTAEAETDEECVLGFTWNPNEMTEEEAIAWAKEELGDRPFELVPVGGWSIALQSAISLMEDLCKVEAGAVKTVRIPGKLYDELWALEVDTFEVDPDGPGWDEKAATYPGRAAFVEAMTNARRSGSSVLLEANDLMLDYLNSSTGPIYNSIDIWRDRLEGARDNEERQSLRYFLKAIQKVINQLR